MSTNCLLLSPFKKSKWIYKKTMSRQIKGKVWKAIAIDMHKSNENDSCSLKYQFTETTNLFSGKIQWKICGTLQDINTNNWQFLNISRLKILFWILTRKIFVYEEKDFIRYWNSYRNLRLILKSFRFFEI